jgi:hypothetical protein
MSMLVCLTFDFIGFLIATLISNNHAAKCGARTGLGVILVKYGFVIRTKMLENQDDIFDNPQENPDQRHLTAQGEWICYIFIIVGWFLILRSNAEYVRIRRLKQMIECGGEIYVTQ